MEDDRLRLIVGLGNPGEQYRYTRHNMGFMVVDQISRDFGVSLHQERFQTVYGTGKMQGCPIVVVKPMTFMNRVGPAVNALTEFFALDTEDVLVVYDDIDLLFGRLKIRQKGGDGGHNGVKSLIEALGSNAFSRVRVGIGRPEHGEDVTDYVLNPFDAEQKKFLKKVISRARNAVETALLKGISEAMNQFHGKKEFEKLTLGGDYD